MSDLLPTNEDMADDNYMGQLSHIVIASVHFPRASKIQFARGEWEPAQGGQFGRSAAIICPACGRYQTLNAHTIREDGTVTPRVACTNEFCDFAEFIRLGDWHT